VIVVKNKYQKGRTRMSFSCLWCFCEENILRKTQKMLKRMPAKIKKRPPFSLQKAVGVQSKE